MADGASYGGLTTMLVMQNANISLLAKALQQQKHLGQATVQLVEAAPVPQRGAPEPGKGSMVDVVA